MYSSRSPIPAGKKNKFTKAWKGVWAYSFPRDKLLKFSKSKKFYFESEVAAAQITTPNAILFMKSARL